MISENRILEAKRNYYNPIAGFDLQKLVRILEQYDQGYLGEAAVLWQQIEERDDQICPVAMKRKSAVAGRPWDIVTIADLPDGMQEAAEAHKAALKFFYDHVRTSHVFTQNQSQGFGGLVRQMMDAVGKGFAVHEIAWQPTPQGLTARFRFVPLQFFENRTGRLRFLASQFGQDGVDMPGDQWLVTAADKVLMKSSSIAFAFKRFGMHDWNIYNGRHGMPGIHGQTKAAPNSPEWTEMETAIGNFGKEYAILTDDQTTINKLDMAASGQIPFPQLIDRMDRAIAVIWRGSDLSTLSQGQGLGASVQSEESDGILNDDVQFIAETLNEHIDRQVIRMMFGDGVEPLAYLQIKPKQQQNIQQDLAVDQFLLGAGAPIAVDDALERYGRTRPDGDALILRQAQQQFNAQAMADPFSMANERLDEAVAMRLRRNSLRQVGRAIASDLEPLRKRLAEIVAAQTPLEQRTRAMALRNELPHLLKEVNDGGQMQQQLENMLTAATLNGAAEAATRL